LVSNGKNHSNGHGQPQDLFSDLFGYYLTLNIIKNSLFIIYQPSKMTKIMKMKKPSRASRAYKSYLIHSEKLKCVPCKKVFRSARLKRRHCVILGHTPKIVAPTFGKDYSEDEKKDRTTCMVCQESTRGKSGRVYTHLVNPREVVTCRTCIR
jgi:hypothetical protein